MSHRARFAAAMLAWIIAILALALSQLVPPAALPADAPAHEFSGLRAMEHVRAIAQAPHPSGSPEIETVRQYLIAQLAAHGLSPETPDDRIILENSGTGERTIVRNLYAVITGTASTGTIVLMAHYDSVPGAPGAADNASGTAILLETLRALRPGPPLRNDLLVLFTDAEEQGLTGAYGFVRSNARMANVRLVVNLDTFMYGPAVMSRTNPQNGWVIAQLAASGVRPLAVSWSQDVARLLPIDTDFTPFAEAGVAGYHFWTVYSYPESHSPADRPEIVDPASVQQGGAQVLALVRYLGDRDLSDTKAPDEVYFTAWGPLFVHYPASLALPLAAFAALLYVGVVLLGVRAGRLDWLALGRGLLVFLAMLGAGVMIALVYLPVRRVVHPVLPRNPMWHIPGDGVDFVVLVALTVLLVAGLYLLARRKVPPDALALGALLPWTVLAVATAIRLPGASYMFLWPLLAGTLAHGAALLAGWRRDSWARRFAFALAAVPVLLLWGISIALLFLSTATFFLPALISLVVLVMGALAAQGDLLLPWDGSRRAGSGRANSGDMSDDG